MRLGELLLQHRVIVPDQLRGALEAQRSYGGRLGTNLFQLGFIDIDLLSRALGQQHNLPAALRKHVAAIDKRVTGLFSAKTVESYRVIPIGYTTTKPSRLIVACMNPATVPVEEVAFAAGCRVDLWITPELLIQECLEKYYGFAPAQARYVEVNFGARDAPPSSAPPLMQLAPATSQPAIPRAAAVPSAAPSAPAAAPSRPAETRTLGGLTPPPPPPSATAAPAPKKFLSLPAPPPEPEPPPPPPSEPPDSPPIPAIRTVAPPPPPVAPRVASVPAAALAMPAVPRAPTMPPLTGLRLSITDLPPDDGWDSDEGEERVVAPTPLPVQPIAAQPPVASSEAPPAHHPVTAPPDALRPVIDRAEASRMLEMATSKEHVGRVLEDWLRSTFGCGLVLIVKNEMAMGWKGFFPDAEDLIEAVAVPLDKPSVFSAAYEKREVFFGSPTEEGAKLNQRMWKLLRCPVPSEVLVCPVVVGKRAVNMLYAQAADEDVMLTHTNVRDAEVVAADAAAAYMRLIRKERAKA
jgi:hypothetical protein